MGDGKAILDLAAMLVRESVVNHIALNGFDGRRMGGTVPGEASEGRNYYHDRLVNEGGVVSKRIYDTQPAFNTREENDAFLQLAIECGWDSAIIVAWPHQLLRAMLGLLAAMKQRQHRLNVFTSFPKDVSWDAQVAGSQSANHQTRFDEIAVELERIERYQAKGDMATFPELFDYLR